MGYAAFFGTPFFEEGDEIRNVPQAISTYYAPRDMTTAKHTSERCGVRKAHFTR